MVNELKKNPETYPYPHKFNVQYSIKEFVEKYSPICNKGQFLEEVVTIAGRVTNIRCQSKKLIFYDLKGDGLKLQVMCNLNNHKGDKDFSELHSTFRRGDIIGVKGSPGRTEREELSIAPGEVVLLSPCLHMLP